MRAFFSFSVLLLLFALKAQSQNCGQVQDFQGNIVNNGNGTSTYTFYVTVQAVSGGSKSVRLTIQCPGGTDFITNVCVESLATARVMTYGPYTRNTCSSNPLLVWSGHSNSTCGGTSCGGTTLSMSPLPVELTKFESRVSGSKVTLNWSTASEIENQKFEIECSHDGRNFEVIGEVAGNGTTLQEQHYDFTDDRPKPGINYYRLKQVDFNGQFEYSPVISAILNDEQKILVYPSHTDGLLTIQLPENLDEPSMLSVYSMHGQLIFEEKLLGSDTEHAVDISTLPMGAYFLEIKNGNQSTFMKVFRK